MIVREDRAADYGKRGVGADKVLRRIVHEIEKFYDRLRNNLHGSMFAVDRDTVLIEVRVRRELPEPLLSAERKRNRTEILTVYAVSRVTLVFRADHA